MASVVNASSRRRRDLKTRRVGLQDDVTELNCTYIFNFWRTDQMASSNALQLAPSNGVGDYVTTRMYASTNDQWVCPSCPLVSSSKTKPCQFSSVQLRRSVHALTVCNDLSNACEKRRLGISVFSAASSCEQRSMSASITATCHVIYTLSQCNYWPIGLGPTNAPM